MDPVLNSLLMNSFLESSTTDIKNNLLEQLRSEGGEKTVELLCKAAEAIALARCPNASDAVRLAAEKVADQARDSTFPAIIEMESNDDSNIDVPFQYRCVWLAAFSLSSIQFAEAKLLSSRFSAEGGKAALRAIDLALLRGGPHWNSVAKDVIEKASVAVAQSVPISTVKRTQENEKDRNATRKYLEETTPLYVRGEKSSCVSTIRRVSHYKENKAMSPEEFRMKYMDTNTPVVIYGALESWPALQHGGGREWSDSNYLLKVAGERIVPVETCDAKDATQTYLSKSWKQQVTTLEAFIEEHVNEENDSTIAYLAQHPLFDQIPALRNDIETPTVCQAKTSVDDNSNGVHVNAWFGPKHTVSPLHYDPYQNVLCQVVGYKMVILVDAKYTDRLYRREKPRHNNSAIDLDNIDYDKFPDFQNVPMRQAIIGPGDFLYIPRHCWHYVRSVSRSFSISFWWGKEIDIPVDSNCENRVKKKRRI
eukprot:g4218.t1